MVHHLTYLPCLKINILKTFVRFEPDISDMHSQNVKPKHFLKICHVDVSLKALSTYTQHTDSMMTRCRQTTCKRHADNMQTAYRQHTDRIQTADRKHTDRIQTADRQQANQFPFFMIWTFCLQRTLVIILGMHAHCTSFLKPYNKVSFI